MDIYIKYRIVDLELECCACREMHNMSILIHEDDNISKVKRRAEISHQYCDTCYYIIQSPLECCVVCNQYLMHNRAGTFGVHNFGILCQECWDDGVSLADIFRGTTAFFYRSWDII